jgi:hypothetical protein
MKGQVETRYGGATLAMDQPEFDGVDQIRIFERNAIFGEEVFDFKDNIQVPLPVRAYRRNLRPGHSVSRCLLTYLGH